MISGGNRLNLTFITDRANTLFLAFGCTRAFFHDFPFSKSMTLGTDILVLYFATFTA